MRPRYLLTVAHEVRTNALLWCVWDRKEDRSVAFFDARQPALEWIEDHEPMNKAKPAGKAES